VVLVFELSLAAMANNGFHSCETVCRACNETIASHLVELLRPSDEA
jgi:hypothetical protein